MKPPTFRQQLRAFRKARSLSQSGAARALGVPVRTLQAWEIGRHTPEPFKREILIDRMTNR